MTSRYIIMALVIERDSGFYKLLAPFGGLLRVLRRLWFFAQKSAPETVFIRIDVLTSMYIIMA